MAVEIEIPQLEVYDDSALVIKQITGEFDVKKVELVPFREHTSILLAQIPQTSLHYIPRTKNGLVDALARIAASLAQLDNRPSQVPICERWVVPLVPLPIEEEAEEKMEQEEESLPISIHENEAIDWREPISNFSPTRHAPGIFEGTSPHLLDDSKETHAGICGTHQARPKLHMQVKRLAYYWQSMLQNAIELARACKACQLHADYINHPPEPLHPTIASWPYEAWGMDIVGPIAPKLNSDRQYNLATTNYFSKWAEAATFLEV
ncbi:hypothetical protein H6P81_018101 [Aristolochia fimbriata]|uniref:RNase H type-1 domain-containing protein n=1 Tax=Aristolochia fimbriata TaxID=158543 RepID=A0AAV7E352_ARIFI|nr:hypothetical protein H6P81_018101 [Aristolochia fimbriata]